jgi:bacteriocin-like protein
VWPLSLKKEKIMTKKVEQITQKNKPSIEEIKKEGNELTEKELDKVTGGVSESVSFPFSEVKVTYSKQ